MEVLVEFRERLLGLISLIESMDDENEIKSHLTKYLCILICGYIEFYIKHIITEHNNVLKERGQRVICTESQIEALINPKFDKLRQWARKHGTARESELIDNCSEEQIESLNSLFRHRHWIAHGKTSDISLVPLKQFFLRAEEVIPIVETAFRD